MLNTLIVNKNILISDAMVVVNDKLSTTSLWVWHWSHMHLCVQHM